MLGAPYKTKKALKESVGRSLDYIETSLFGAEYKGDGNYTVVGPDPYRARNWFATVSVVNGVIAKVK